MDLLLQILAAICTLIITAVAGWLYMRSLGMPAKEVPPKRGPTWLVWTTAAAIGALILYVAASRLVPSVIPNPMPSIAIKPPPNQVVFCPDGRWCLAEIGGISTQVAGVPNLGIHVFVKLENPIAGAWFKQRDYPSVRADGTWTVPVPFTDEQPPLSSDRTFRVVALIANDASDVASTGLVKPILDYKQLDFVARSQEITVSVKQPPLDDLAPQLASVSKARTYAYSEWGGLETLSVQYCGCGQDDVYTGTLSAKIAFVSSQGQFGVWGIQNLQAYDASQFGWLSFWVKGERGGERFQIKLKDSTPHEDFVDSSAYITVNTTWQRVFIPLADFMQKRIALHRVEALTFGFNDQTGTATVFIDDIRFETKR